MEINPVVVRGCIGLALLALAVVFLWRSRRRRMPAWVSPPWQHVIIRLPGESDADLRERAQIDAEARRLYEVHRLTRIRVASELGWSERVLPWGLLPWEQVRPWLEVAKAARQAPETIKLEVSRV